MITRIMLGVSLGAFINAFLFAAVNITHSLAWAVVGGISLLSILRRSSKAETELTQTAPQKLKVIAGKTVIDTSSN